MNICRIAAVIALSGAMARGASPAPAFDRDILPILRERCTGCHRTGGMAPVSFETYSRTRPWAAAIREATAQRKMPPWFADPCCGHFANDPSLTPKQIETISAWVAAGAPQGRAALPAPPLEPPSRQWNIGVPDSILTMPRARAIPATGDLDYQYVIIPTGFSEDRWVRTSEILPGDIAAVHHAVAWVREPGSAWLRGAPVGVPFSAADLASSELKRDAARTTSDILLVYAPGSSPDLWPPGYAKLIPAGSDIVLQMHYTTRGKASSDRTRIGLVFAKQPPARRVLTLQLTNDRFIIPPGDPDHRVEAHGSLPNDAELLGFFPHMHLRGKSFEYNLVRPGGARETLLRIPHYDFYWQLTYRLAVPLGLKAGTVIEAVATFDNSRRNRHNPDPDVSVRWGEQSREEMMVGFFDVAVAPDVDKARFFLRSEPPR